MRILSRVSAVLAATLLALCAAMAVTSPASAAGKPSSCGNLLLCLYTGDAYTGSRQDQYERANGTCDGVLYNDTLSSVYNDTTKSVRLFNDAGCTGTSFVVTPHTGSPHMTIYHANCVDETTSFRWGG